MLWRHQCPSSQAHAHLHQCESFVLNALAEGILGLDSAGRIIFVNHAFLSMTGWTMPQLIGQSCHELLHHTHADGEPYPSEQCPIQITLHDQRTRFVNDDVFWRQDGGCFPVEYSVTPMRDHQARVIGVVVVVRDVTQRRGLAERVRRLELEQSHQARVSMLGEMVSGIGHELNQPLTVMGTSARAGLRLLESGQADLSQCAAVLGKIARQAERAAEVIRTLRRLSRKEAPATPAQAVPVLTLFDTVAVLLGEDARRAGIALHLDVHPDSLCVLVRQTPIEQVLINLTRNGLEAMNETHSERRVLRLQARAQAGDGASEERIEIRVVDTGPGLSRGLSRHLLEPFVTTKPQGIGLGLSISARILESHDSQLQWQTTPGIGTTFYFSLPRARTPPAEQKLENTL